MEPLWKEYKRIIKKYGAIVLFSSQPFTTLLIASNLAWLKYEWVWEKTLASGFLHAKNKPLKSHENIVVFSEGAATHCKQSLRRMAYYPQMQVGKPYSKRYSVERLEWGGMTRPGSRAYEVNNTGERYPRSVVRFANPNNNNAHPTQKPVPVLEYFLRTYTQEGEVVLDNCCGSGSTGVACLNTGRNFIGMEKDEHYSEVARKRLQSCLNVQEQERTPSKIENRKSKIENPSPEAQR